MSALVESQRMGEDLLVAASALHSDGESDVDMSLNFTFLLIIELIHVTTPVSCTHMGLVLDQRGRGDS